MSIPRLPADPLLKLFCPPLLLIFLLLTGCAGRDPAVLRLATTTSTEASGLLAELLPDFEVRYNARVDVIAVGTGQALALGAAGDADVILVHALQREEQFIADGHGTERFQVMYNDFVLVGPANDPAGVHGTALAKDALARLAAAGTTFASRGDDSGTHSKERSLWAMAGLSPDSSMTWYKSLGQGMAETLRFAQETGAYTLTDRGTFLALQAGLPDLVVLVGGANISQNSDPALLNPYGVIPIDPDKGNIQSELAREFVSWLTSLEIQARIAEFGRQAYGQPLFYPDSREWREQ